MDVPALAQAHAGVTHLDELIHLINQSHDSGGEKFPKADPEKVKLLLTHTQELEEGRGRGRRRRGRSEVRLHVCVCVVGAVCLRAGLSVCGWGRVFVGGVD